MRDQKKAKRSAESPEQLVRALRSGDEAQRLAAAEALGSQPTEAAAAALIDALRDDPAGTVRRAAAGSLGRFGRRFPYRPVAYERLAVEALVAALGEADVELRQAAAAALGRIGSDTAAPALLALLESPHAGTRQAAAAALMRVSWGREVSRALGHPSRAVRLAAARAVAEYVAAFDVLKPWASSGWYRPEKDSEAVAVNPAVEQVVAALGALARDRDPELRRAAVAALRAIRDKLAEQRENGVIEDRDDDDDFDSLPGPSRHHLPLPLEVKVEGAIADAAEPGAPSRGASDTKRAIPPVDHDDVGSGGAAQAGRDEIAPTLGDPAPFPVPEEVPLDARRFADLTFFRPAPARSPVPAGQALRAGDWYEVEVAVRLRPTGIPPEAGERRPLREPRQKADVTLHVTAEGDGFEVAEAVDTLVLPPRGDSTKHAVFRVRPLAETATRESLAELRVRLYYLFNLLEEVVVRAEVVGRFDDPARPRLGLAAPIAFRQARLERLYLDLDHVQPRALHVDVGRAGDRFLFRFAFYNDLDRRVEFLAAAPLAATDLEDLLVGVRRAWYELALSDTFATRLEAPPREFTAMVRRLASLGHTLWVKLFKLERDSAMARVGAWLQEHPPAAGATIQVALAREAAGFAFPWALLYDRPLPARSYELPDAEGFWGLRYAIEQQPPALKGTDEPVAAAEGVDLGFMQWQPFRNIGLQNALMEELARQSGGRFRPSRPPIDAAADCYALLDAGRAHILYFYAHGSTRRRGTDTAAARDLELFRERYDGLPPDSPLRAVYEPFVRQVAAGDGELDRSWIELTYGKLYLEELYDRVALLGRRPLVILNLCESAQLTPALADSFVHFFLDRGASAVVGTECPMTIEFAHPFAERLLCELFGRCAGRRRPARRAAPLHGPAQPAGARLHPVRAGDGRLPPAHDRGRRAAGGTPCRSCVTRRRRRSSGCCGRRSRSSTSSSGCASRRSRPSPPRPAASTSSPPTTARAWGSRTTCASSGGDSSSAGAARPTTWSAARRATTPRSGARSSTRSASARSPPRARSPRPWSAWGSRRPSPRSSRRWSSNASTAPATRSCAPSGASTCRRRRRSSPSRCRGTDSAARVDWSPARRRSRLVRTLRFTPRRAPAMAVVAEYAPRGDAELRQAARWLGDLLLGRARGTCAQTAWMGRGCFHRLAPGRYLVAKGVGPSPRSEALRQALDRRLREAHLGRAGCLRLPTGTDYPLLVKFRLCDGAWEALDARPEGFSMFGDVVRDAETAPVYRRAGVPALAPLLLLRNRLPAPWGEETPAALARFLAERLPPAAAEHLGPAAAAGAPRGMLRTHGLAYCHLDAGVLVRAAASPYRVADLHTAAVAGDRRAIATLAAHLSRRLLPGARGAAGRRGVATASTASLARTAGVLLGAGIVHGQLDLHYQNVTLAGELADFDSTSFAPPAAGGAGGKPFPPAALEACCERFWRRLAGPSAWEVALMPGLEADFRRFAGLDRRGVDPARLASSLLGQVYDLYLHALRVADVLARSRRADPQRPGTVLGAGEVDGVRRSFAAALTAALVRRRSLPLLAWCLARGRARLLDERVERRGRATLYGWASPEVPLDHTAGSCDEARQAFIRREVEALCGVLEGR